MWQSPSAWSREARDARARASRTSSSALRDASTLATVGWLIAKAALRREESRGGHFRADFPARDDVNWKIHIADTESTIG